MWERCDHAARSLWGWGAMSNITNTLHLSSAILERGGRCKRFSEMRRDHAWGVVTTGLGRDEDWHLEDSLNYLETMKTLTNQYQGF